MEKKFKSITVKIHGKDVELKYLPKPIIHDKETIGNGYYGGVLIADMSDDHIINSINYIEKNVDIIKNKELQKINYRIKTSKGVKGKKRREELEKDIEHIMGMTDLQYLDGRYPVYNELKHEAEKREII
jgi:hypothetical protein